MIWHVVEGFNAVINVIAVGFVGVTVQKGRKALKTFEGFGKAMKK